MLTLGFLLTTVFAASPEPAPTTAEVRQTIQHSIPYIQEKGEWWIEKKKCVSCHRVNNMVWSLNAARAAGFEVSGKLDQWRKWSTDSVLAEKEGKIVGLSNKEGVAQLLLALDRGEEQAEVRRRLTALLLRDQQPDGSWKPGGQLPSQKRPKPETAAVSTMWLALALGENADDQTAPVVRRSLQYLEKSQPGKSVEWFAGRLLLAVQNEDEKEQKQWSQRLHQLQRKDGGWGWLVDEKSDALGTGLAIYALAKAGLAHDQETIRRGQMFLMETQQDNGSWKVHGTKQAKRTRVAETASYWGATWAVLGLIASLET